MVYLCENRPDCRGLMSAHPNGEPCGTPADAYTRKARRIVHEAFDSLWQNAHEMYGSDCTLDSKVLQSIARKRAYAWLAERMGISVEKCHISMMDVDMLRTAWRIIMKHKPTMESIRSLSKIAR